VQVMLSSGGGVETKGKKVRGPSVWTAEEDAAQKKKTEKEEQ